MCEKALFIQVIGIENKMLKKSKKNCIRKIRSITVRINFQELID